MRMKSKNKEKPFFAVFKSDFLTAWEREEIKNDTPTETRSLSFV
jgi:hypothetical protein